MRPISLRDYAESEGIEYITAWRRLKRGFFEFRKEKNGTVVITGIREPARGSGRPKKWDRENLKEAVRSLCKDKHVATGEFPSSLYKLCVKHFGSVRKAKIEARILSDQKWTKEKFLEAVQKFCTGQYRDEKKWPPRFKQLAKRFCGSPRSAKWEAGVIRDLRRNKRQARGRLAERVDKEQFLLWVKNFCEASYKKPRMWPGFMRILAVRHCGSIRAAKWEAGVIRNKRAGRSR